MVDTASLIKTYKRSQDQLIKAILSSKSVAFNSAMLQTVNAELAKLQGHTVKWVEKNIPAAYVSGMDAVNASYKAQLLAAGKPVFKKYPTQFSVLNRKAINVLVENTKADFTNALGFVGRKVKDDIRQASLEAIADKVGTGTTVEKTRKILAQKFADQGLSAIKYQRKGKDVFMSLDAYAGTVARSTTAEATNTGTKNQVEELGEDLVQMTQHSSSCPVCSVLEGRVYSISGKNKSYPPLDKAYTDGYANIHPNCGHRLVPYIAELKTPEELEADLAFSKRSFDPDKWKKADREKLEANLKAYKAGQDKKRKLYTDRQQWERYKAELGSDKTPKSLSGFRSMKKADGDKWKELQGKYRTSAVSTKKQAAIDLAKKKAEEEAKRKALEEKIARRKAQIKAAADRRKAEALVKKASDEAAKKAAIELAKKKAEEEAKIARRKAQIKAAADRRKAEALAKKTTAEASKKAAAEVSKKQTADLMAKKAALKKKAPAAKSARVTKVDASGRTYYEEPRFFSNGTGGQDPKYNRAARVYVNEKETEFIWPAGYNTNNQPVTPDMCFQAFKKLPSELQKQVKQVSFVDYINPRDAYWESTYKIAGFRSGAVGGSGEVTFFGWPGRSSNIQDVWKTLAHEAGHSLDQAIRPAGFRRMSESPVWAKAQKADTAFKASSKFTSDYALRSNAVAEDFADAVKAYTVDPGRFKVDFPNRYCILKDALGGA